MSEKQVYKHAEGKGSLFKNNYKEKDNHPDMTGSCTDPNGVVWELAGWKSTTQGGDVYLSISIEKPFVKTKSDCSNKEAIGATEKTIFIIKCKICFADQ